MRNRQSFVAMPVAVLGAGEFNAGQEIAISSVIALKAAWLGKGGST